MKPTKRPQQLAKNASALHKHVGELLTSMSALNGYEIRQEYSVKRVDPAYPDSKEKFDWVVLGAKIIIECHGEQHYQPVRFGGISEEEAKRNLFTLQARDEKKQLAAHNAGWTYVVVKYTESKITAEELSEKIKEALAACIVRKSLETYGELLTRKKPQRTKTKRPNKKIPSRPFQKKKKP